MNGRFTVLVVASDGSTCELIEGVETLGATQLTLLRARGLSEAQQSLSHDRIDAVMLDLASPNGYGLDTLIRLHEHAPDIPIIVLTDPEDEALAVRALEAGAQDSLIQGQVDGHLLVRAVRYAIERQRLQMALQAMALVDDLTGLYNRRGFQTLARQQFKMAERLNKRVTHLFVDVDGLKAINDTFGHRTGDLALLETAELLKETFRETDILARIGGDEFVVLALENAELPHEQWTTRLQEHLEEHNAHPNRQFPLSLSFGVAYYDPEFPCPLDELMHRADSLMYEQKRGKRRTSTGGSGSLGSLHEVSEPQGIAPRAD